MNLLDILNKTTKWFETKGVDDARLNTEYLLAHVLKLKRMDLYLQFDRPMSEEELNELRPLVSRRGKREPLQHIVGTTGFREINLKCDSRALIPRSDTEQIVDVWYERYKLANQNVKMDDCGKVKILEIGVGTGAICLSLAKEFGEKVEIVAVDISADALSLAKENEEFNKLDGINWFESNLFSVFEENLEAKKVLELGSFDYIISNPPYIAPKVIEELEPEVKDYDPMMALDGGGLDGLDFIKRMFAEAPKFMKKNTEMILEIGYDQGEAIESLLNNNVDLDFIELKKDYSGNDRFVILKKN